MQVAISASREALNTINPIRRCIEGHFVEAVKSSRKELIKVSIGDPAIFGNLPPHPSTKEALKRAVDSNQFNGMCHSMGLLEARQSVAQQLSKYPSKHPLTSEDVFLTCGTHGALEASFRVLCDPGRAILLSRPCYTIYRALTDGLGILPKHYNLLPDRGWEVDLSDLEQQLTTNDGNVAAIVVNNPSNPCGSVYSKQHLLDILSVAERHSVPIIADEVYADMVFKGKQFHPIGSLSENVPVLTCGSISKRFLVPGWRCGWLAVHDRHQAFASSVKLGIANLMTKLVAPPVMIQAALPDIFANTPDHFFTETMEVFEKNATLCYERLKDVPGLTPVRPEGAMYMMVRVDLSSFPEFENDLEFTKQLIVEEGVVSLPGSIFQYPDSLRIVLIMPLDRLDEACHRIAQFCASHYKP